MSNQENPSTQKFIRVGNALVKYLQIQLPYIFDPSFGRTYPTMWCTLGYFCDDDFEITDELRHTFEEIASDLKNQTIVIDVDKVQIVKFHKKSLDKYELLGLPIFL